MDQEKKPIEYIDIHSHLNFPDYEADFNDLLERMEISKVATITVGTDLESSRRAVQLAEKYSNLYACIGQHPEDNATESFDQVEYEKLLQHPKIVAIGECGLDFFRLTKKLANNEIEQEGFENEKKRQKELFKKQIDLAIKYNKPLMIHARDAYREILEILDEYFNMYGAKLRGNAHFFAGTLDEAKAFLKIGFTLSFTGVITFARQYDELIKYVPLESLHIETDAPFVTPVPYRGERNEPSYVVEVAKKMAEIKDLDLDTVKIQLLKNSKRLFGI